MKLEPSKKTIKVNEEYRLGKLRIPDYEAGGKIDIGVFVLYTKETDELGKKPTRECARFKADWPTPFFTGSSIYSAYVKYTHPDGSARRMFLSQAGNGEYSHEEETEPKKLADPSIVDTRTWGRDLVSLIDQLPPHVRDLFNFSD